MSRHLTGTEGAVGLVGLVQIHTTKGGRTGKGLIQEQLCMNLSSPTSLTVRNVNRGHG